MLFHEAAEVAVGEDAGEFAVGGGDGGHAEFLAEAAGGMEGGEVVMLETAAVEQGNGQSIADGHGYRGACGGSEIKGASFFPDADVENDFAGFGESGFRISGEGDDGNLEAL